MAEPKAEGAVEIDEKVQLTETEKKAVQEFISEVSHEGITGEGNEANEGTAIRFLRARKFDIERAVSLYNAHKNICAKFDLEDLRPFQEPLRSELLSGKFTVLPGKDLAGASVCLFTERLHFPNETTHQAVLKSIIFQLNEVTKSDETQLNGIVLIYDMKWASYTNFDYDLCMKTLSLLKGAFPARLKHVYILSAPFWFRATLAVLSSFLREKIRNRVEVLKTSQDLLARIPVTTVPVHLGGQHLLDHELWLDQCIGNQKSSAGENGVINSTPKQRNEIYEKRSDDAGLDEIDESQEEFTRLFPTRRVPEFVDYVAQVGKERVYEEYHYIKSQPPLGTFQSSRHPFNLDKNRYRDVLCYDHSRVKLDVIDEDDFSDYINANYVDGFQSGSRKEQAYICTQGPLENTAFDFWRMVFRERVKVIVMITRCVERGKQKCSKYWPSQDETFELGFLRITNSNEEVNEDYVARDFVIHNKRTNITNYVKQIQFISWPDFGVLSSASKFLTILNKVREFQNTPTSIEPDNSPHNTDNRFQNNSDDRTTNNSPPVVVHCSAGIGRTGTFIASDISVRGVENNGVVNIPSIVREIRGQRAFCIQTEEQYAFCYSVILEYLKQKSKESGKDVGSIDECLDSWHE